MTLTALLRIRHKLSVLVAVVISLIFCWDHLRLPAPESLQSQALAVEGQFSRFSRHDMVIRNARDHAFSIDCRSAAGLCDAVRSDPTAAVQARLVPTSSFGGYFAVSAHVGGEVVTRADDAAQRFERVRRGHLLQRALVMLAIPLAIFLTGRKR